MPDREKYIEVLSKVVKTVKESNEDAPIKISLECIEDILTLLKEHEPVDMEIEGGGSTWWYVCEECHGSVDSNDLFCRHCGRPFRKRKCIGCVDDCPKSGNFVCPNGKL